MLEKLEPKCVFNWFEKFCAIPHGSRNTKAAADFVVRFAEERRLEHYCDAADNVIVIKPATAGYEGAEPVILQGHLDMVCAQTPSCTKNLETDGLTLRTDGKNVWADGTTLGGDDGIAVAFGLALLDADDLPHPRLEVVLTSDEEIGMLGAAVLDVSPLQGRKLLNLDSEDEGVFTTGCAGGVMAVCRIPLRREPFSGESWELSVTGLLGGHSGEMIDRGRGNAMLLLGRLLRKLETATALRLQIVEGGEKDNAIPVSARAVVSAADGAVLEKAAAAFDAELKAEYRIADPDVQVAAHRCDAAAVPMDEDSTRRVLCLLACIPNGVQERSMEIPGLTQTSLNLGILRTEETALCATTCIRSSFASQKEMLVDRVSCLTEQLGGSVELTGDYPAWEFRPDSPLRTLMTEVYREQSGREPEIAAIHGGVECGLLSGKIPGLDCISCGPDIADVHTPQEKLDVESTARTWRLLTEVLRRSK
jgi:dipeptidase D